MQGRSGDFKRRQRHVEEERWSWAPGEEEADADAQQLGHS